MYTEFYSLSEFPFQITPDSRFFFGQGPHKKALAYASYGLNKGEGFVVITGEIGAGKTTLVNYLLSRLQSHDRRTANLVSTKLESDSLLKMVATAFGLPVEQDDKATLLRKIEAFLATGKTGSACGLLIVDEVQNLSNSSLEELRMLSNFQRDHRSLLQIFMVGQPEFRDTLQQPEMEQLRQRVVASFHLGAMDELQTRDYIEHRLTKVGWRNDPAFEPNVFSEVHRAASGIPRRINLICDRLLVSSFLANRHEITVADIEDVINELRQEKLLVDPNTRPALVREFVAPPQVVTNLATERLKPAAQNGQIAEITTRLRDLDYQMQEQEKRLDQILADGLLAVSEK